MKFTKCLNRFENAIVECSKRFDWIVLKSEAAIYERTLLEDMEEFKKFKKIEEQDYFTALQEVMEI